MTGSAQGAEVRVAIAGLGRFGTLHAGVLGSMAGTRLVAVCDPDPARRDAVGDALGVADRHAEFDALLEAGGYDALFLVTPEQFHAAQAKAALAKGLPLFLEKPLATTADEGAEIVAAARAAGVPLQLGFVLRFDAQHALIREEIASGRMGDLVSLRVKRNCSQAWFADYGERVHTVYETSIHDIDLLLWLVGAPCVSVYAVERNVSGLPFPDACFALLRFANGAVAMLETSWFVPEGAPANVVTPTWRGTIDAELEIVGTRASARTRLLDTGPALWQPEGVLVPETGLWPQIGGRVGGALREEDAHFVETVRSGRPSTVASADDAVSGLRIAEAIIASAAAGVPVALAG